ncbi:site-specific integrase, partial [candidate division KSB1 bacterium]|nr:site-specific integrase [candidate division KSB1 bacterium]
DKIRFLELDAIERVREAFENDEMHDLVEFYLLTGTRIMEPLSLTWDDVDNKREQIIIRALNTKAKRNRVIVFKKDAKLKKLIKSLPKRKDNLLFGQPGRDGQRSRYSVYNKIKRILVELEYPWASPHTFRHTFISHLVMAGVPLTTVQKLVGHADFSTTLKYAHLASDHTDEMISKRPF